MLVRRIKRDKLFLCDVGRELFLIGEEHIAALEHLRLQEGKERLRQP